MNRELGRFQLLARGRRSIRRFQSKPVADEVVRDLLETACLAPSAHNRQPWRFVVLRDGEPRRRLVERMTASWEQDLLADGQPSARISALLNRNRERLLEPPVVVLVCMTMEDMDLYPDDQRQVAERTMAIQSVAMAGGHLLLAAHAQGLGACWICGPLFVPDLVRAILDLPPAWEPQGVIALGYPSEPGRDKDRKPLDQVVHWR